MKKRARLPMLLSAIRFLALLIFVGLSHAGRNNDNSLIGARSWSSRVRRMRPQEALPQVVPASSIQNNALFIEVSGNHKGISLVSWF